VRRLLSLMLSAGLLLALGGCAPKAPTVAQGQAAFGALQQAVAATGKAIEPGLVLVKVQKDKEPVGTALGGMIIMGGGGSPNYTGVVLTREGYILVPAAMRTDPDDRITAWIGANEYVARVVKTDDTLGMAVLKIHPDEPLTPVSLANSADLAVGQWSVTIVPSDEDSDYQKFRSLMFCRGEQAGRYRRFLLGTAPRDGEGAPVLNLSGQIVGFLNSGAVWALNDLREDLQSFIADATGGHSVAEEKNRGWLGAMLAPINKEYAQAHKLPASALWVLQVSAGGPAALAGVHAGDLVTGANGQPLRLTGLRAQDYFIKTLRPRVNNPFELTVLRAGQPLTLKGKITRRPELAGLRAEDLGVAVQDINDTEVYARNLASTAGVLVTEVVKGSPAAMSGTFRKSLLAESDLIVELNGQPTPSVMAFNKVLDAVRRQHPDTVLVKYWRGPETSYAALNMKIGEKENGGAR